MKTAFQHRFILILIAFGFSAFSAQAALPLAVGGNALPSLAPMVKQASPAVVNIAVKGTVEAQRNNPFMNDPFFRRFFNNPQQQGQPRTTVSAGSGVIVDAANGYILTNHHVIENADEITVTLFDERELVATVVGSDARADIAVIQVPTENLSQIPQANSEDLEVGDFVIAIGNPFGFSHTVTSGIVSGLDRYGLSAENYENFIQTDAAINPGNSGGALLNLQGELIGINTAIISNGQRGAAAGNIGIGFAIPINMARTIMDQILEYGEVRRGLLGVIIRSVDEEVIEAMDLGVDYGAMVQEISPGSAAEKAGLKLEDVIVAVNGERVKNATELRNAIGLKREGTEVAIDYYRDRKLRKVTAILGSTNNALASTDAGASDALHPGLDGATFENLAVIGTTSTSEGVLVVSVDDGSSAARAGLQAKDIITRVNRQRVTNLDQFDKAARGQDRLRLTILRGSSLRILSVG